MPLSLSSNWEERAEICAGQWGLSELKWLDDVSTARVGFCQSQFGPTVLKVSLEPGIIQNEARVLAHFGESLCPRVFATEPDFDAMIMERLDVVEDLSPLYSRPEKEIDVWLSVYQSVVAKTSMLDGYRTLSQFAEVFDRMLARSSRSDIRRILTYGRDKQEILMGSRSENRLLHGDMHHFNILHDQSDRWRLIDPHGVIGHPHYELGAFLRNPWDTCYQKPGVFERLRERVLILAKKMNIDAHRVAEFGFYGAAFSIAWSVEEESDDYDGMVVMAEACLKLLESL